MTDNDLKRCKEFLDYFRIKYDGDIMYLTDGGNSVICNPDTEWNDFLGSTVNGITEIVAKELDKKLEWI